MNILITGSSGFLGMNLIYYFRNFSAFELFGCSRSGYSELEKITNWKYDLTKPTDVRQVFIKSKPRLVIHSAALTNVDKCEEYPEAAYENNVIATENVASECSKKNLKMIYISTDMVYKDHPSPHKENFDTEPLNVYSKTKLEGENVVKNFDSNNLILRTNFFGWSNRKTTLAEWIVDQLRNKNDLFLFNDVFFSPVYAENLCEIIHRSIDSNLSGIYNCGGKEIISKYYFGICIASIFPDLSNKNIKNRSIDEFNFKAKRPKFMGMDCTKLFQDIAKYITPRNIGEQILQFKSSENNWEKFLKSSR